MNRRATLLTVTITPAIGIALVALTFSSSEPTYKGATIHEWLRGASSERREALLVIGTNNLPFLVQRLAYAPEKDRELALYFWFEQKYRRGKIDTFLSHAALRSFE